MPRAFDRHQLIVDRNPLEGLHPEISKLPKFELGKDLQQSWDKVWNNFVLKVQELTGLNFSSAQGFVQSVIHIIHEWLHVAEWQTFINNLWLNLTGVKPDTTISANDAVDQFALLMATTAAQATSIAQLQAAINKPAGGIVGGDDFERPDADTIMPGWDIDNENGSGHWTVNNGQAVWKKSGILGNTVRCFRDGTADAKTATPFQVVTRVTGTTVLQPVFLAESAEDHVYARVSDDHKSYMVAWWDIAANGKGRLHLAYNLGSGNDVEVEVVPCDKPSPGVPLTIECGDNNPDPAKAPYSYRVIRGNTTLIEWDDPNRKTTPLINNRGWGFGGRAKGGLSQLPPSSAHSVTVADTRAP